MLIPSVCRKGGACQGVVVISLKESFELFAPFEPFQPGKYGVANAISHQHKDEFDIFYKSMQHHYITIGG